MASTTKADEVPEVKEEEEEEEEEVIAVSENADANSIILQYISEGAYKGTNLKKTNTGVDDDEQHYKCEHCMDTHMTIQYAQIHNEPLGCVKDYITYLEQSLNTTQLDKEHYTVVENMEKLEGLKYWVHTLQPLLDSR
jgi:hypothetical protein